MALESVRSGAPSFSRDTDVLAAALGGVSTPASAAAVRSAVQRANHTAVLDKHGKAAREPEGGSIAWAGECRELSPVWARSSGRCRTAAWHRATPAAVTAASAHGVLALLVAIELAFGAAVAADLADCASGRSGRTEVGRVAGDEAAWSDLSKTWGRQGVGAWPHRDRARRTYARAFGAVRSDGLTGDVHTVAASN